MFMPGSRIKVSKTEIKADFAQPTPDAQGYSYGRINEGVSVPNGYWITGVLVGLPSPGGRLVVVRDTRNGVKAEGIFQTSQVQNVYHGEDHWVVETNNSVYIVEPLEEDEV